MVLNLHNVNHKQNGCSIIYIDNTLTIELLHSGGHAQPLNFYIYDQLLQQIKITHYNIAGIR